MTATWLLWRRSKEPEIAFVMAAAVSAAYWTPLFYIPLILPAASWWAGKPGAEPHLEGMVFYPNLAVAGVFLLITIVAYRLAKTGLADMQRLAN